MIVYIILKGHSVSVHPMTDAIVIAPWVRGCCCYGNASILCSFVPVFEIFFLIVR